MWRVAAGAPAVRVNTARGEVTGVTVGDRFFATEPDGGVRPYFSRRNPDRAVSAIDVLQEKVAGERLKRSFVLIGATALSLGDSVFTPVGEKIPGVELHAQLLENMNDGTFLVRPAWAEYVEAGVLLLLGGLLIAAMPRLSLRYALPVALASVQRAREGRCRPGAVRGGARRQPSSRRRRTGARRGPGAPRTGAAAAARSPARADRAVSLRRVVV